MGHCDVGCIWCDGPCIRYPMRYFNIITFIKKQSTLKGPISSAMKRPYSESIGSTLMGSAIPVHACKQYIYSCQGRFHLPDRKDIRKDYTELIMFSHNHVMDIQQMMAYGNVILYLKRTFKSCPKWWFCDLWIHAYIFILANLSNEEMQYVIFIQQF